MTFLEAARLRLVDQWFQINKPGGVAFRVKNIFYFGKVLQIVMDHGLAGSETAKFDDIFAGMLDGRIIPLAEEQEERIDEDG